MAVCSNQTLADAAQCFRCHSPVTLRAIITLALYNEAVALGYSVDNSVAGIVSVAECTAHCLDEGDLLAAAAKLAVDKANLAGAAMSTNVETLVNQTVLLEKLGNHALNGAILAVLCTMGEHDTP